MARASEDIQTDIGTLLRMGTIASVDHASGLCTIRFGDPDGGPDDGEVETAQVRWGTARAGKTRTWSPPSEGEQILFACPDGEIAAAVPLASIYSNANPAPGNSTREVMIFDDGAELAYDPDAHHMDIKLPAGATLAIEADGGITIKGNVTITGTLTATTDVIGGGKSLKTHKHGGVQTGGGQTGEPA